MLEAFKETVGSGLLRKESRLGVGGSQDLRQPGDGGQMELGAEWSELPPAESAV